jgi:hypothetical protein
MLIVSFLFAGAPKAAAALLSPNQKTILSIHSRRGKARSRPQETPDLLYISSERTCGPSPT